MTDPLQDNERRAFQAMSQDNQILSLFDMLRYMRAESAATRRAVLDLQNDITTYRSMRELSEASRHTDNQTTSQKVRAILKDRFDTGAWFRDKVLPQVVTLIVIALLYLAFQKP